MRWTASTERWRKRAEQDAAGKAAATIVDTYLSPVHRDDPGHGCAVPALGAEIARESPKTRKAFAGKLEQMVEMMADQIPDVPRKAARKQAMATLATMMGTMVLARIAGIGELSDEVLKAGKDSALDGASASRRAGGEEGEGELGELRSQNVIRGDREAVVSKDGCGRDVGLHGSIRRFAPPHHEGLAVP